MKYVYVFTFDFITLQILVRCQKCTYRGHVFDESCLGSVPLVPANTSKHRVMKHLKNHILQLKNKLVPSQKIMESLMVLSDKTMIILDANVYF